MAPCAPSRTLLPTVRFGGDEVTKCTSSILESPDRAKAPRPGNRRAVDEDGLLCPVLSAVLVMLVALVDLG